MQAVARAGSAHLSSIRTSFTPGAENASSRSHARASVRRKVAPLSKRGDGHIAHAFHCFDSIRVNDWTFSASSERAGPVARSQDLTAGYSPSAIALQYPLDLNSSQVVQFANAFSLASICAGGLLTTTFFLMTFFI